MKNIVYILIILLVVSIFAGCSEKQIDRANLNSITDVTNENPISDNSSEVTNEQPTSFEDFFKSEDESNIKMKLINIADYRFYTPIQLYENATLVLIGSFTKNNGSFVEVYGRIMTNAEVSVEKVIKGNYDGKAILVVFYGGKVPFLDYYNSFDESSQKKMGIDISSIKSSDLVQSYQGEHQAYPLIGKQYLIFLNRIGAENKYFLGSDAYAMLEIKDGMYCDRSTNEWENIDELGMS